MTAKSKEELAQERLDARTAKDFAKADQLRDQIAALGFDVIDVAGGFEFRTKERFPTFASTRDLRPIKINGDIAIAMIVDGSMMTRYLDEMFLRSALAFSPQPKFSVIAIN